MGITERHWFEDEEPELTEQQLEDIVAENQRSYEKGYADAMKNAVPLDKLCVWLSKFGSPCEIDENMCDDAHGVDRCVGIFNSSAFCWQYWLTKMMEEQDAAD